MTSPKIVADDPNPPSFWKIFSVPSILFLVPLTINPCSIEGLLERLFPTVTLYFTPGSTFIFSSLLSPLFFTPFTTKESLPSSEEKVKNNLSRLDP